jgi:hypothetical protein
MEILGLIVLLLASGITLIAFFAAISLLFPAPVQAIGKSLETSLGRSLLLGVVNFLFFFALAVLIFRLSEGLVAFGKAVMIFFALLILAVLAIFILGGLAALTRLLGGRLGNAKSPLSARLSGALLLILACLTPYVGWFLLTPLAVWISLGAAIQAIFRRKTPVLPVQETPGA